jgi:hypothetical protein
MKNLDKSPGMCSNCPQITPKIVDLEVFPTCLRKKERVLLERKSWFGERRERDSLI